MKYTRLLYQVYTTIVHYIQNNTYYIILFALAIFTAIVMTTHDKYSQCIIIQLLQIYHGYRWTTNYIKSYCLLEKQCTIPIELFTPITITEEKLFLHSQ